MSLRIYWLLLMNLAVTISAETVHSYGSQYGREPENLAEANGTPVTSEPLPQKASCNGPCFEMVSTSGSSDLTFQNSSGVASQRSRHNLLPLRDVYSSPTLASSLNSSSLTVGSKLIQNVKLVVFNKNAENDSSLARVVYGPIYRLRKPHGASGSPMIAPSTSSKPPVSSSVTSKPVPTGQNGYKSRLSQISYNATQLGNTYNAVISTSRNAPSRSNMVVASGPIIFIKPNQTNDQVVQTIIKTQSSYEPGASKPFATVDQPTAQTSEASQGMNYQRPASQSQVSTESLRRLISAVNKPVIAPKSHLASEEPSPPQFRTTESRFAQLGNVYSSADTTYKPSNAFTSAQATEMQQMAKPVQSSQQLASFSRDVVYDRSSPAVRLRGSGYRFMTPGSVSSTSASTGTSTHVPSSSTKPVQSSQQLAGFPRGVVYDRSSPAVRLHGSGYRLMTPGSVSSTSASTGTSTHVPSSSTKPVLSDHMQHFYQAGLSSPRVGYSTSSAVVSGDSNYGFAQSGNVYGPADNAQPAVSSSNLSQNPYFVTRQGQSYYSMFKPLQSNYKSLPTRYTQMPSRSFSAPLSQPASVQEHLNQMIKQMSNLQAVTSGGVPTSRHYSSVLDSNPVRSGYVVDQTSNQQGILVKPSQFFRPLSFGSPESWYASSQPGSRFVLRGSRPVLNF